MKLPILHMICAAILVAQAPQLFLLKTYKDDMNVTGWVMSEKYDGVRAYWDGQKLISRSGKVFSPPEHFTKDFPSFVLDGELWSKRGEFENIVSIVNSKDAGSRWNVLSFMVFEVPEQKGDLFQRLQVLDNYLEKRPHTKIKLIKQTSITKHNEVKKYFEKLTKKGAEGIVVRNPALSYYVGRKKDALKYKLFLDAECKVVSIMEGRGKYKNKMGTLGCDFKGNIIKIGSGFSDKQRNSPPSLGSVISFKYYGLTSLGNPKYPVFLRARQDTKR